MKRKNYPAFFNRGNSWLLIGLSLFLFSEISAQTSTNEVTLNEAQKKYELGDFESVLQLLGATTESGLSEAENIQAYKLLAMTYLAVDSLQSAENAVSQLLKAAPNYEPNLFDPPKFIQKVKELKLAGSKVQVTSVSKRAENSFEAPANVMVITEEEIKNRGYSNLEALFSDLPGFDVSRTYGSTYSNIYQRGYRSNNTDRTLFLLDGVEENELWSNFAYWSSQYSITNVKKIEIVYGPASTMYGANAFVGVVNVITKDPEDIIKQKSFGVNANAGFGKYDSRYADVTVAGKYEGVSLSATVRKFYSREMDLSSYEEYNYDPSDYDRVDYKKILSVTSNASTFIRKNNINESSRYFNIVRNSAGDTVAARLTDAGESAARNYDKNSLKGTLNGSPIGYSNLSDHTLFSGKLKLSDFTLGYQYWKSITGSTNYNNDLRRAGADNGSLWAPSQSFFYLKYETSLSPQFQLSNLAQYRVTEISDEASNMIVSSYANLTLGAADLLKDKVPFWTRTYFYQISRQFRNEFKVAYSPGNSLDIVSGLELRNSSIQGDYRNSNVDSASVIEIGTSTGDQMPGGNDFTQYDIGLYAQGTYRVNELLKVTLGGRYDYDRIRVSGGYGSIFNPRVALIYTPGDFVLKLIYSSAFQNASNWTKYATTTSRRLANATLPPEKVKDYEFSLGYKLNKESIAEVVMYYSNYNGVVGTAVVPYNNGTTGQNRAIGALRIYGLQADAAIKILNYSFYANYTYTNPQNNILDKFGNLTGEYQRIADIAAHRANLGINGLYFGVLNINLRLNYTGPRPVGPGTSVPLNPGNFPAFILLNGAVTYSDFLPGLSCQFIINNILDKEYFDPGIRAADGITNSYRTPQKGRDLSAKLLYNF